LKEKSTASLSEKQIETEILVQLNRLPNTFAWKNHTTGVYDPMRKTFRRLSGFAIRGVSDILGIHEGRMICLEVKSAKGRLRPEQKDFLERMTNLGAVCGVVRSWSEALRVLQATEPGNPDTSAP
jgi:hypothetical protein